MCIALGQFFSARANKRQKKKAKKRHKTNSLQEQIKGKKKGKKKRHKTNSLQEQIKGIIIIANIANCSFSLVSVTLN
jgi:hypothetical protein